MTGFTFDARARRQELQKTTTTRATVATVATLQRSLAEVSQLSRVSQRTDRIVGSVRASSVATVARHYVGNSGGAPPLTGDEQERAGLAADRVPEVYLDAWARIQCKRPAGIDLDTWRQTVSDAGLFLDEWGALAAEWGWLPADLFDTPTCGIGGFAWFARACTVVAFGPEHARLSDGRVYDRIEKGVETCGQDHSV